MNLSKRDKQQARERAETGPQRKDFQHSVCMKLRFRIQVWDPRVSVFTKFAGEAEAGKVYWYTHPTWKSKMVDAQNKKFVGSTRFIPFTPYRVHGNTVLRCRKS